MLLLAIFLAALVVGVLPISGKLKVTATSSLNLLFSATGVAVALVGLVDTKQTHFVLRLGYQWLSLGISLTKLGALFLLLVSFVAATTSIYSISLPPTPAVTSSSLARSTFIFSMMGVVSASNALSFTFAWELMTISSAVLVASDVKKYPSSRSALLWYLTMSQMSAISLILGFSSISSTRSLGSSSLWTSFALSSNAPKSALGVGLLLFAFGIKVGLIPVHVWLPKAHPAAPAEISALMSGSMVAMGVYGMIITVTNFGGDRSIYWGEALIIVGAMTAIYSIIKAAIEDDLKVLLAQSTSENMGLIAVGVGTYICDIRLQDSFAANCALLAVILLTFAHAFFKQILFMAAGSIYSATKTKRINELGGLGSRMKFSTSTFSLGAIGAVGLPPSLTFVAEWLLLQTLSHSTAFNSKSSVAPKILFPLAIAAIALTTGIAVVTFTKIVGVGFLGLPRTSKAKSAVEVSRSTLIAPLVAATFIFAPAIAIGYVAREIDSVLHLNLSLSSQGNFTLSLPLFHASITPLAIAAIFICIGVVVGGITKATGRSKQALPAQYPWGCGQIAIDSTFQTSGSGFTEPILRIFDDVINPGRDVQVSHESESFYFAQRHLNVGSASTDLFEIRLLRPTISAIEKVANRARRIQGGSIHLYLIYAFIGLIVVISIASL